jgi:hypothetical protein
MRYGVDTHRMCGICKKKLGVYWGLVDKISPAFEQLRNSGVSVSAVARSFQLSSIAWILNEQARVFLGCRPVTAYQPLTCLHVLLLLLVSLQPILMHI